MKLKDILKTVGSGLISTLVPGGPAIVAGINAFLPENKKLPDNATGTQAANAIEALPPEQKASVLNKEYDVTIEEIRGFTERFKYMAEVDKTGNTTRPQIAMMMAQCVAFSVIVTISLFAVAAAKGDAEMIKAIVNGWPFIVGVLTVPSTVITYYFGKRTIEKQQKYEATTGISAPASILAGLFKK